MYQLIAWVPDCSLTPLLDILTHPSIHVSIHPSLFTSSRNMSNLDKLKAKTTLGKLYADHLMRYVSHSFIHLIHQSHPSHPFIHPLNVTLYLYLTQSLFLPYSPHAIYLIHSSTSSIHPLHPSITSISSIHPLNVT